MREPELSEARFAGLEAGKTEALATTTTPGNMPAANFAALSPPVANLTALQAIPASARADGMTVVKLDDGSKWRFSAAATATDSSNSLVVTPSAGSGAWLRHETHIALTLPFTYATADAAVLFTVPTGARLKILEAWWEITADMTGGSNSAIGVHASVSGWSTKGDILGGASGDLAATLVASNTRMVGTVGAKLDTNAHQRLIMIAGDTLVFDRIASAFAAGSGNVRVLCHTIANLGA